MNAVRPIAVKLDQDTRDRLKRLAAAKDRSTHWMLREAVTQFVEREEKREAFRQAGLQAWEDYKATGKHVTDDEADVWLAKLEAGEEAEVPEYGAKHEGPESRADERLRHRSGFGERCSVVVDREEKTIPFAFHSRLGGTSQVRRRISREGVPRTFIPRYP